MPELPEVETIRRTLRPRLLGAVVRSVAIRSRDVIAHPAPAAFARLLVGCRLVALGRRGKYLLLQAASHRDEAAPGPGGDRVLVIHLRMTGRLVVASRGEPEYPHTHVVLGLDGGDELRFSDVRRFGRLYLYEATELPARLLREAGLYVPDGGAGGSRNGSAALAGRSDAPRPRPGGEALPRLAPPGLFRLGPEPLGGALTAAYLYRKFRGRRAPVKGLLLDQGIIAGLGNIYADEVLFRVGIHPATPASRLDLKDCERLVDAIRQLLRTAVEKRGTTFSDYLDGRGVPGGMRPSLQVYGRAAEPCPRCGTPVYKIRVAGRGTHYCPRCQPPSAAC